MSVSSSLWVRRLTAVAMVTIVVAIAVMVAQKLRELKAPVESVDSGEVTSDLGDRAVGVYEGFEFIERVAGRKIFELISKRTLGLSSGWHEIEGVRLQFYRAGELGPVLTCDGASFNIQTRDARLGGSVRIEMPSGAILTTDAGAFEASSGRFSTNADVLFVSGATFGRARTATYDLEADEIVLGGGVTLVAEDGTALNAATAVYQRSNSTVVFPEGGEVTFELSKVEAPLIRLVLEEQDGPPRQIELLGGVTASGEADGGGRFEAWMGDAVAESDGNGKWQLDASTDGPWIRVRFFEGEGYFERELQTSMLRAVLSAEGLINLRAEEGVCFREVPTEGPVRMGEAKTARVWFADGQATDVELVENVVLRGGEVEGRGFRARLSATAGLTMLHGDPTGPERVLLLSDRGQMSCDQAQLFNREGRSEARGNVQGMIHNVSLMGAPSEGEDEPVHFAAEVLDVRDDGAVYHMRENIRLWQGRRLLLADDLFYRHDSGAVRAAGHVRTTLPASQLELEGDPGEDVVVVSRSLDYDQVSGAAVYRGNVRYSDPNHTLAAAELSVFFDQDNKVTAVEAVGAVELVILETGRRMTGQTARREVATRLVTLTGSPVRLTDPAGNEVSGSSLTWNQADGTVSVAGGTETIYYPEETP